jgi:hypothetical protein
MPLRPPAGFIRPGFDPLKNPNAPTIGTASPASPTSLSIAFTAPGNVGGSAITSFIATARRTSDGVLFSASGAASPITITGLTAVAFTVTVVAVNSYGPSASSAASNSVTPATPVPVIGSVLGGGFFAGQISTVGNGIADFNLVIGPASSADTFPVQWKTSQTSTAGTGSNIDGPTNSANMNNADHPAAQFCEGLTIGGYTDWYMPAKNELEICYFNLKPTTTSNDTDSGINPNAVPARASNYTSGNPAQTSSSDFKDTGTEDFTTGAYWSSTEYSDTDAWDAIFGNGFQRRGGKTNGRRVRAVRRVPV